MAVIEYARHVVRLKGASSTEVNLRTKYPVIDVMTNQAQYLAKRQYGGTIRLGAWPCVIKKGSRLEKAYQEFGQVKAKNGKPLVVDERHRHRYEFNGKYRARLEKAGLVISGLSPDGKLVEAIELPDHPFFIGTQFHPEYLSRPLTPHPLFLAFIKSML